MQSNSNYNYLPETGPIVYNFTDPAKSVFSQKNQSLFDFASISFSPCG